MTTQYTAEESILIEAHEKHRKSANAVCNDFTDNTPYKTLENGVKVRATRYGQRYDFRAITRQGRHFDGRSLDKVVSDAISENESYFSDVSR
jgi:hypothetical protein